jgi:hypothetical protein
MISNELSNLISGLEDEAIDVDGLFATDVAGKTGLFPGQLVAELAEVRPGLLPRIVACVESAICAPDAAMRTAGIRGALHLPRELRWTGALRRHVDREPNAWSSSDFIELVARQPSQDVVDMVDTIARLALEGVACEAQARLLAAHRPDVLKQMWLTSVTYPLQANDHHRLVAQARAMSSTTVDALATELAHANTTTRRQASEILFAALGAAEHVSGFDRWLQLHRTLQLPTENTPSRPAESEAEAERRRALAARLAERAAKGTAGNAKQVRPKGKPKAPPPREVVLGLPVWIDALRIPEGPPSALFEGIAREKVRVLRSDALLAAIDATLANLGWSDVARDAARASVESASAPVLGGESFSEASLARAAGLDTVWTVGPDVGETDGGVTFQPVHRLLAELSEG